MRHRFFLLAQVILMIVVPLLFRGIEDRKVAATIAGFLFLTVPAAFLVRDFRVAKGKEPLQLLWRFGVLQFLILFAIPIFWARVFHWNMDFSTITVAGVPAPLLHRFSNWSFLIMALSTVLKVAADFLARRSSGAATNA